MSGTEGTDKLMSHPIPTMEHSDPAEYAMVEEVSDVRNEFGNIDEYREKQCVCPDRNFPSGKRGNSSNHEMDCDLFSDDYEAPFKF